MKKLKKRLLSVLMLFVFLFTTSSCSSNLSCVFNGHDFSVLVEGKEPTCEECGYEAYKKCKACNAKNYFLNSNTKDVYESIPALGHNYVETYRQEPTCTEKGFLANNYCLRCHSFESCQEIPANGHTFIEISKVEATCTTDGYEAYMSCSICGITNEEVVTIPALGHDFINHPGQNATCTETGWDPYQTCSRCDYSTFTNIDPIGHNFPEEFTIDNPATCTEAGLKHKACTNCGNTIKETIEPTGHDFIDIIEKKPTCTTDGLTTHRECSVCHITETQPSVIAMLGHDYDYENIQWTWNDDYTCYATITCKRETCTSAEPNHSLSYNATVIANTIDDVTCTIDGLVQYTAYVTIGGTTYTAPDHPEKTLPHTGHTPESISRIEPTCTTNGYINATICSTCKLILDEDEVIPMLSHDYGDDATDLRCNNNCETINPDYTKISSSTDLKNIGNYSNGLYYLDQDIDFGNTSWTPLSNFQGTLDGDGHTISNIKIGSRYESALFSSSCGTIKNLTIHNMTITSNMADSDTFVGAIVANQTGGLVSNCMVKNSSITGNSYDSDDQEGSARYAIVGAIVGKVNGGTVEGCKMQNCSVSGTSKRIDSGYPNTWSEGTCCYVGGIAGELLSGTVKNCSSSGTKNIKSHCQSKMNYVGNHDGWIKSASGGVIGRMYTPSSTQSGNSSSVSSSYITATSKAINQMIWWGVTTKNNYTYTGTIVALTNSSD